MKNKTIATLLVLLTSTTFAFAGGAFDESIQKISWDVAHKYYGQECIVYGTVVAAKDIGSRCFLNFHKDFRTNFTVVIESKNYDRFPEKPDSLYAGKHVRVVGEVIEFKGKPEIVIKSPDEIQIVDNPDPAKGVPVEAETQKTTSPAVEKRQPAKPVSTWKPSADGTIRIATFNLFNLFDNVDDPYNNEEPLPGKDTKEIKLLADRIRKANADIVAVQEVENRQILEELVNKYLPEMGYRDVVLFEGNNKRGIDVGLISRYPLGKTTSYRHLDFVDGNGKPMRFRRDLLQVNVRPKGFTDFDVFVVHLKSKGGGEAQTLPTRLGEATAARTIFDDLLKSDRNKAFVVCGDFNDTYDSKPLQQIVGTGPMALKNLFGDIPEAERITYNKEPYRSMIDFLLVSPAMADMYVKGSYEILYGSVASGGSDHNPVVATFKLKRQ